MAKQTLADVAEDTPKPEQEKKQLPAKAADTSLAVGGESTGLSGEFDRGDINLPRVNVVAKTSKMVDDGFAAGSIVLNKEVQLVAQKEPLAVIVLDMEKRWQEDVEYGGEEMPAQFATLDEAEQNGFSSDWEATNKVRPMANFRLLVEAPEKMPEGGKELFPYTACGKSYAMAAFTVAKTAYNSTAKNVASFVAFAGGEGVWTAKWQLVSALRTNGENTWFNPTLKKSGTVSGDLLDFVESVR